MHYAELKFYLHAGWRPTDGFCAWLLSRDKHETYLPHECACSVYELRTDRMLARKSTYMFAGGHKVDSVLGTFRCASKTHDFPTKALIQLIDHIKPEYLCGKATACRLKATKVDSASGTLQKASKKHCFTTKALVQCMHHAQPEC